MQITSYQSKHFPLKVIYLILQYLMGNLFVLKCLTFVSQFIL